MTIKRHKAKKSKSKVESKEASPYGEEVLRRSRTDIPSVRWNDVKPEAIGEGFEPVEWDDEDDRETHRPKAKNIKIKFRRFKNRFVIGQSRFISYNVRKVVVKTKEHKRKDPINASAKVTKPQRKAFGKALDSNIKGWVKMFMEDVMPVTMSIRTATEEVKDRMAQLVDDSVIVPDEYAQNKLVQAVQLRIVREVVKTMKLTPDEAKLLAPEFYPKKPK